MNLNPREIKSQLKSYRINPEPEKPERREFGRLFVNRKTYRREDWLATLSYEP